MVAMVVLSGNRPRVTDVRVPLASFTGFHVRSNSAFFLHLQPVNFHTLPRFSRSGQTKTGQKFTGTKRRSDASENTLTVSRFVAAVHDERARSNNFARAINS
jgi:hypothetical protein